MSVELIAIIITGSSGALAFLGVAFKAGRLTDKVETLMTLMTTSTKEIKDLNTRVSHLEGAAGD